MQPQQQNQYDFIMDTGQKRGGPAFLQNPKNRILASIIFVGLILIGGIILFNVFTNLGKQNNNDMVELLAYQTEIARISELGLDTSTNPDTRSEVSTILAFITSDANATQSYLTKNGVKLTKLEINSKLDASVEKDLERANQLNKFDEVLLATLDETGRAYKATLQSALDASSGNRKDILTIAAQNIIVFEKD